MIEHQEAAQIIEQASMDFMEEKRTDRAVVFGILEGGKLSWGANGMTAMIVKVLTEGVADMLSRSLEPKAAKQIANELSDGIRKKTRKKIREMEEKALESVRSQE